MDNRLVGPRRMRARWVALFATVLLSVSTLRAQNAPQLRIVGLEDGATVDAPVTVRVEHSGVVFDGVKIGSAPEPGVGHWHVNVDGQYAGLSVSNVLEIPNDAFPTITAGEHTITVDLHENNHAATDPPVSESITLNFAQEVSLITPKTGSPTIRLADPGVGADGSAPIVVRIEHSGIVFDGVKIGSAPEPGVGHWHVNVDGQYAGLSVSNVLEIPNDAFPTITAGEHTITVDLHENNHAATDPPVSESFEINLSQPLVLAGSTPGAPGTPATTPGDAAAGHSSAHMPNTGMTGGPTMLRILTFVLVAACLLQSGLILHLLRYDGLFRRSRRKR